MMKLLAPWAVIRTYLHHPLGRRDRLGTIVRMLRWQLVSRLLHEPIAMPFVDGLRLLVRNGMRGATGNIYVGLMEFEEMAFALHLLHESDLLIDVGANVGTYSLLAASRGASVLALEPVPETYQQLLDNVYINRHHQRIDARNVGVGSTTRKLEFSAGSGPTDHVLATGEDAHMVIPVQIDTLDNIAEDLSPTMIKIDVEGYEFEVIRGGRNVLAKPSLKAIVIELNGLGARYGFNDSDIHEELLQFGFAPANYEPFTRNLSLRQGPRSSGNTIYVRHSAALISKIEAGKSILWRGALI